MRIHSALGRVFFLLLFLLLSFWFMSADRLMGLLGHSAHCGPCRAGAGPGGCSSGAAVGWQPAEPPWALGDLPPNPAVVDAFLHFTCPGCREGQFQMSLFGGCSLWVGLASSGERMGMESPECSSDVCEQLSVGSVPQTNLLPAVPMGSSP